MKKFFYSAVLIVMALFVLSACSNRKEDVTTTEPVTENTTAETTEETTKAKKPETQLKFELESLPDIGEYKTGDVTNGYFYSEGALDEFRTNDKYGKILPYSDQFKEYISSPNYCYDDDFNVVRGKDSSSMGIEENFHKEGFITADGKIITEAVYDYTRALYDSVSDKVVYEAKIDADTLDKNKQEKTWLIAEDGSWMIPFEGDTEVEFLSFDKDGERTWWDQDDVAKQVILVDTLTNMYLYDFDGNKIFDFKKYKKGAWTVLGDSDLYEIVKFNDEMLAFTVFEGEKHYTGSVAYQFKNNKLVSRREGVPAERLEAELNHETCYINPDYDNYGLCYTSTGKFVNGGKADDVIRDYSMNLYYCIVNPEYDDDDNEDSQEKATVTVFNEKGEKQSSYKISDDIRDYWLYEFDDKSVFFDGIDFRDTLTGKKIKFNIDNDEEQESFDIIEFERNDGKTERYMGVETETMLYVFDGSFKQVLSFEKPTESLFDDGDWSEDYTGDFYFFGYDGNGEEENDEDDYEDEDDEYEDVSSLEYISVNMKDDLYFDDDIIVAVIPYYGVYCVDRKTDRRYTVSNSEVYEFESTEMKDGLLEILTDEEYEFYDEDDYKMYLFDYKTGELKSVMYSEIHSEDEDYYNDNVNWIDGREEYYTVNWHSGTIYNKKGKVIFRKVATEMN